MSATTIIAIDGPSASGKSSTARRVAELLGYYHVDTGSMYRILTWKILEKKIDPKNTAAVVDALKRIRYECDFKETSPGLWQLRNRLDGVEPGQEIRTPSVDENVSAISAIPEVRAFLVQKQRDLAKLGDLVVEGRDIGTVVFPETPFKFFLEASPEVRARRRAKDQAKLGVQAHEKSVSQAIAERDRKDSARAVSPLKPADDAIRIDTSDHEIQTTADIILKHIRSKYISMK